MIRYSRHVGALKVRHRADLCAVPDHRGIATQEVDGVLCHVNIPLRDWLVAVLAHLYAVELLEKGKVREMPGSSEPPIAFRLVG